MMTATRSALLALFTLATTTGELLDIGNPRGFRIVSQPDSGAELLPKWGAEKFQRFVLDTQDGTTTAIDEGSTAVEMRPTLDFLFNYGKPRYVMAGLQTRNQEKEEAAGPLAQQWTVFDRASTLKYALFAGSADGTDKELAKYTDLSVPLELVANLTASPPSAWEFGFKILSVPLDDKWLALSGPTVTCVASAEEDIKSILTLPSKKVANTPLSFLQFPVEDIETGSCHAPGAKAETS